MFRSVFVGVALAVSSAEAAAQITTYVTPRRASDPQIIAAADSAQRDSIARSSMTNMKAWVDSAAGVAVPAHVGDSVVAIDTTKPVTTTFQDGAIAPATATVMPMLALGGLIAVALGAGLLATRPRR